VTDPFGEVPDSGLDGGAAFPWPAEGRPLLDTLGTTWRQIVLEPARFFAAMPRHGPIGPVILFYLIMMYAGAGVSLFWRSTLGMHAWIDSTIGASASPLAEFLLSAPFALGFTFLGAAVLQASLIVLGARTASVGVTLRVLLFGAAPAVLQIVPWLGSLLAAAVSLVVTIVGVRTVHATTTGRAITAVLAPLIVMAMIFGMLLAAIMALALSLGFFSR
jgi:hypothetical protein